MNKVFPKRFKEAIDKMSKKDLENLKESPHGTATILPCPTCGHRLIVRRNRTTGTPFLGCSAYPECTTTHSFVTRQNPNAILHHIDRIIAKEKKYDEMEDWDDVDDDFCWGTDGKVLCKDDM